MKNFIDRLFGLSVDGILADFDKKLTQLDKLITRKDALAKRLADEALTASNERNRARKVKAKFEDLLN